MMEKHKMQTSTNNNQFELIIMDCQMPEMDGYEASRQIRSGVAGDCYSTINIIAMTANTMQGDREKCIDAGMTDYIAKPIDPEKLLDILNIPNILNLLHIYR